MKVIYIIYWVFTSLGKMEKSELQQLEGKC